LWGEVGPQDERIYAVPDRCSFLQLSQRLGDRERAVYGSVVHYWAHLARPLSDPSPGVQRVLDLDTLDPTVSTLEPHHEPGAPYWLPVFKPGLTVALDLQAFEDSIVASLAVAAVAPYGLPRDAAVAAVARDLPLLSLPASPGEAVDWVAELPGVAGPALRRCQLSYVDVRDAVTSAFARLDLSKGVSDRTGLLVVTRWAPWLVDTPWVVKAPSPEAFLERAAELQQVGQPLYLKTLDRIEFRVQADTEELTILVCDAQPAREGERFVLPGRTLGGHERFEIPQAQAYFPVFINGEQELIGDKPAVLKLTAPDATPTLVTIQFEVTIGRRLVIKVLDCETQMEIAHDLVAQEGLVDGGTSGAGWNWRGVVRSRRERLERAYAAFVESGASTDVERAAVWFQRNLEAVDPTRLRDSDWKGLTARLEPAVKLLERTLRRQASAGTNTSAADDLLLGYSPPAASATSAEDRAVRAALERCPGLGMLAKLVMAWAGRTSERTFSQQLRREMDPFMRRCVTQLGRLYGAGGYAGVWRHSLPGPEGIQDLPLRSELIRARSRLGFRLEDQLELLGGCADALRSRDAEVNLWALSRSLMWHCDFPKTRTHLDLQGLMILLASLRVENRTTDRTTLLVFKQDTLLTLIFLLVYGEFVQGLGAVGTPERDALEQLLARYEQGDPVRLKQVSTRVSLTSILKDLVAGRELGADIQAALLRLA
jgi:hypothetical protein